MCRCRFVVGRNDDDTLKLCLCIAVHTCSERFDGMTTCLSKREWLYKLSLLIEETTLRGELLTRYNFAILNPQILTCIIAAGASKRTASCGRDRKTAKLERASSLIRPRPLNCVSVNKPREQREKEQEKRVASV